MRLQNAPERTGSERLMTHYLSRVARKERVHRSSGSRPVIGAQEELGLYQEVARSARPFACLGLLGAPATAQLAAVPADGVHAIQGATGQADLPPKEVVQPLSAKYGVALGANIAFIDLAAL